MPEDNLKKTGEKPKRVGNYVAGPGRPKGSQNKISKSAKDTIAAAAAELGGEARIVAWAKEAPENEKAFWATIYPKLITVNIDANVKNDLSPEMKKWLGRA